MAIVSEEKFEQIVSIPMTVLGGLQLFFFFFFSFVRRGFQYR